MKKLFFIACFIAYVNSAAPLFPRQADSSAEQLVRIMMSDAEDEAPYNLTKKRNPNNYQDIYNLITQHPKLLKGIIHDGQTFAMLCVQRGYADILERLINENCPVDLATPCNLCGPHEPQTTVLHQLLSQVSWLRMLKNIYPEDYITHITGLTKLIINKYPDLLDMPVNREITARRAARFRHSNINDLIPNNLPQSPCK